MQGGFPNFHIIFGNGVLWSMNKISLYALAAAVLVFGFFALNHYLHRETQGDGLPRDFREVTFHVSDAPVTLVDGEAQAHTALGGESLTTIRYFGNELAHDLDGDGRQDMVFLITQETDGTGTFYYLVGALRRERGYLGTHAVYLGDRIAPRTIDAGEGRHVVVTYAERAAGEPFTASPSVATRTRLVLDLETRHFGEVIPDFEGEVR